MNLKRIIGFCLAATVGLGCAFGQEKAGEKLTLEDAVVKALKNNLDLAVQVLGPEIADRNLAAAKEFFLPGLSLDYNNTNTRGPSSWSLESTGILRNKQNTYGIALTQQIPTGGNVRVTFGRDRSDSNQSYQTFNPYYQTLLRFDFSQPLLRNFGPLVSRRQILVAANNLEVSRSQLEASVLDTIYRVQEAYWNLFFAIEDLGVKRQSLSLARDLLAKNKKEVEVGTIAPLEILNAQATVASREAEILSSEAYIKKYGETLRSLIDPAGGLVPVLADRPEFKAVSVSFEEALGTAMARRPELRQGRTTIQNREIDFRIARNQTLPQLDLALSYWSPGTSGDRLLYLNDNPLTGVIIGREKGGTSKALKDTMKFLYNNWTIGLTLSVPLGDVIGRANAARARLDYEQSLAELKSQEQRITLDVSDAVRNLETNAKRIDAYRVARELAEKRLEAETKKLEVGLSESYFVLDYQERLATARSSELRALVDYNLSLALFEKTIGTSLEKRNISLSDVGR
ncbi:MAG: TolC family protein [Candidatus Aminicenantales bacterium]